MTLRLVQVASGHGTIVAAADGAATSRLVRGHASTYELAVAALRSGRSLQAYVRSALSDDTVDLSLAQSEGRLLAPIAHPDAAHMIVSGTGLTHLGSAEMRDRMHQAAGAGNRTDSMRMFEMGVSGGKPPAGEAGVQPEWFYKGDGSQAVGTGRPLCSPSFALDGSEEPEIAGIYLVDDDGNPRRLGFCLANDFSDHVTEQANYLWLAHSKLRPAALGPELLAEIPADVRGTSRILRHGELIWEKPFLTGEANMSHSIRNLEQHHFKYAQFRRPGDVHVHFFGTATLSFADGFRAIDGDVFEVAAAPFILPLRNPLSITDAAFVDVTPA